MESNRKKRIWLMLFLCIVIAIVLGRIIVTKNSQKPEAYGHGQESLDSKKEEQVSQPIEDESQPEMETTDKQEELSEDVGGENPSGQTAISSEDGDSMDETDASSGEKDVQEENTEMQKETEVPVNDNEAEIPWDFTE